MAPNHGGETLGSILGPVWSHWGRKMGQNRKELPCPKFEFLTTFGHRFGQKIEFTVMAPNHGGDTLGSILGPMGSHWGKKMGLNRQKLPCPKIRPFATPQSSISAKNRIYGYGAKSRWGHPRVHLGANGVPLGPRNGWKPSKITMPKNSNFWLLRGHRFGKKIEFTVMAPNHGGHPLGSILGPMGLNWGPKMGQTVKNYHASKLEFWTTPRSSIWTKNRIDAYGAKSWWGHPRVHLGANGVPLGQKNGSKPWKITMAQNSTFWLLRGHDLGKKSNLRLWRQITVGTPLGPS